MRPEHHGGPVCVRVVHMDFLHLAALSASNAQVSDYEHMILFPCK
jgi:hypothetical protein